MTLRFAEGRGWISEHWVEIPIVALAAACFAAAQAAGGSGFIACFVGGLLLSGLRERHKEELLRGAESTGEALALLTWVVFGGIVVARLIDRVTCLSVSHWHADEHGRQALHRLVRPARAGHDRFRGSRPRRKAAR
ncbi:MAG: hypothetical protein WCA23_12980 [Stellaceae bacterium]